MQSLKTSPTLQRTSDFFANGHFLGPLAGILLGLSTSAILIRSKDFEIFFLFSLFFSIIVLTNETVGLVFLLFLSFYSLYLRYFFSLPPLYVNLCYVLIALLTIKCFSAIWIKKRSIPRTSIDQAVLFFFGLIFISFLLNRPPIGASLKSIAQTCCFIFLFYAIAHSNLSASLLKRMVYVLLIVALTQILASFVQYFFIFPDENQGFRQDHSGGLFGYSSGTVNAVYMVYISALIFAFMKVHGVKFLYLGTICLLVVPIILSSARGGLVFIPLTASFLLAATPFLRGRLVRSDVGQALGLIAFLVVALFALAPKQQLSFILAPDSVYTYSMSPGKRLGRFEQLTFVHSVIGARVKTAILGLGPGQMTHTKQATTGSSQISEFLEEYGDEFQTRQSYAYTTVELGYGGLALFLFLHYKLFMMNRKFFQANEEKFWKAISIGFAGIIFTSAYSMLYVQNWVKPPLTFPFWLLAGTIYRVGRFKGIF
jgi:O-antigen ligase